MKAEGLLRQALTMVGEQVPVTVNLEIDKYLNERGKKKLMQQEGVEFKDPFGVQDRLIDVQLISN
jgi:nitrite reductase (cytochrome c-552)